MQTAISLSRWLTARAMWHPPAVPVPPFLRGRRLTHRERLLYGEMLATHALGLPRTPREWWTLNHLVEHRPRYYDAPFEIPPGRRRSLP